MMKEVPLDAYRQYYVPATSSPSASVTDSSLTITTGVTGERKRASRTTQALAAVAVVAFVALAVAFFFTLSFDHAPRRHHVDVGAQRQRAKSRASRLDQDANTITDTVEYADSLPSGFEPSVDYVGPQDVDDDNARLSPVVGNPEAHIITADAPEDLQQLIADLRRTHPELFEDELEMERELGTGPVTNPVAHAARTGPPGAAQFNLPTGIDTWDATYDETFVDPTLGELALPPPPPPPGNWEALPPPPPPPANFDEIKFQETFDPVSQPWHGPADATWFTGKSSIDVLSDPDDPTPTVPKERSFDAPYLGAGCKIIRTIETGEETVQGEHCAELFHPYHYDIYPISADDDWEFVDMPSGPRTHAWPGAGPFRKIHIQNRQDPRLSTGPVCFDLPPPPADYQGVRPKELDCATYLPRVEGFGDQAPHYPRVAHLSVKDQDAAWWFVWRNPTIA